MKRFILNGLLVMFVTLMTIGCGGDSDDAVDTTKPVITILGDNPVTVNQGATYTDAGATATDNIDGTVNVISDVTAVNTAVVGDYTVRYTATDAANNTQTATRTVKVVSISRKVTGQVLNYSTGVGVAGLSVSAGTQTVTTGADGSYTLPLDNNLSNGIVVKVKGNNYSSTSKIVSVGTQGGASAVLNIDILPVTFSDNFDPTTDFTAQVPNSPANVAISANSLVLENGDVPTGEITANLTPIDSALSLSLMPGDMIVSGGDPIASFGAVTIEFTDASGNALNLDAGESATIRIPVVTRGAVPTATIPLFYYDEVAGFWVEEGTATLSADGTYYEGTVTHFTTWNADYLYDFVTISGCVQDMNLTTMIGNARVDLTGKNYIGSTTARTDSNGNFQITAMQNATSLITAIANGKVSNTISVETGVSNITLGECLQVGTAPLTARLTWGENPEDLDTHIIGPNSYHIWYGHLGTFAVNFASLDVDDTDSYGPEVFTALSFPEAGTYHYAIYHYSGSSTISASPARVEVMLNGQRTVFTPPEGQQVNQEWWNVFDIVVAEGGAISIVPINTWAINAPTSKASSSKAINKMFMPSKN
ncbi:MAG: Unknown protein [uncultured Sulfurovum sp.]|uniref:Pesticidal crystal protein Cry22Aa Ig-like domain-containing protein n=1 Tax=uncultured Sulfurovum sp. TaxID=269237 RepID=A0A6S6TJZ9_9BACT|nr:MAG: Unknown protein [uncultured Sulfurovum sp.]